MVAVTPPTEMAVPAHAVPPTAGATANQARALQAVADPQGFDLTAELRTRFDVDQPEELRSFTGPPE
jgi:hypothetical protein